MPSVRLLPHQHTLDLGGDTSMADENIVSISPLEHVRGIVQAAQEYAVLSWRSLANVVRRPLYVADMIQQADLVGVGAIPIVLAAVFFTGAALALNSETTLTRFGALGLIGQLVAVGIVRELGPVRSEEHTSELQSPC